MRNATQGEEDEAERRHDSDRLRGERDRERHEQVEREVESPGGLAVRGHVLGEEVLEEESPREPRPGGREDGDEREHRAEVRPRREVELPLEERVGELLAPRAVRGPEERRAPAEEEEDGVDVVAGALRPPFHAGGDDGGAEGAGERVDAEEDRGDAAGGRDLREAEGREPLARRRT